MSRFALFLVMTTTTLCCNVVLSIGVSDFYPFGVDSGDLAFPPSLDHFEGPIAAPRDIEFFGRPFRNLFVNSHGTITFNVANVHWIRERFPATHNDTVMIAAYWANIDTREDGSVSMRIVNDSKSTVLETISRDIAAAGFRTATFDATWALIVTHDRVAHYPKDKTGTLTFQHVLALDDRNAYSIFQYSHMDWTLAEASEVWHAQAGFNLADGVHYHALPLSCTEHVWKLNSTSNVGRKGVWMFQINGKDIATPDQHATPTSSSSSMPTAACLLLSFVSCYLFELQLPSKRHTC